MYIVTIHNGSYKGKPVSGAFPTRLNQLKLGNDKQTLYVVINEDSKDKWVRVPSKDAVSFEESVVSENIVTGPTVQETEDQILDRIKERFSALDNLVSGVMAGAIRALVVTGPAGVGKSFGIEQALTTKAALAGCRFQYEFIKGVANPLFLYKKMYEFREPGKILVLDDCDCVWTDPDTLNLFKAALDSSRKRTITWGSESRTLKQNEIPNSFEFQGSIIFISNIKFDKVRSETLREHLSAIESRCHYLDLTINDHKDKLYRIKQVIRDTELLTEYGFEEGKQKEILEFLEENIDKLREVSLRTIKKIADLMFFSPNWRELAKITCVKS
jgi:hypothetical protein